MEGIEDSLTNDLQTLEEYYQMETDPLIWTKQNLYVFILVTNLPICI